MESKKIKLMVRYALMMALTTVMTMLISIPNPATKGYLNLGDMVVFLAAMIFGKKGGFIVGGLGSALADVILGYGYFAPFTLIVKGLEGFIAGWILEKRLGQKYPLLATITGGIWMAMGYFMVEIFMVGMAPAASEIPGNLVQGGLGAITAVILGIALSKTGTIKVNILNKQTN